MKDLSTVSPAQEKYGRKLTVPDNHVEMELHNKLPEKELMRMCQLIETTLPDSPRAVVQFTSAYGGEGARRIAFETAIFAALSLRKRVLYIDTKKGREGLTSKLASAVQKPLTIALTSAESLQESLVQINHSSMYYSTLFSTEVETLTSSHLKGLNILFEELRKVFDLIILGTEAVFNNEVATALARFSDGNILVVEAERTRHPVVQQVKDLLEANGGMVIGAVLNKQRLYIPKFIYRAL